MAENIKGYNDVKTLRLSEFDCGYVLSRIWPGGNVVDCTALHQLFQVLVLQYYLLVFVSKNFVKKVGI